MKDAALKLALDALENSVDLVFEAHTEAVRRYGDYPTRKGKIDGLKVLADKHQRAIDAVNAALAQPAQQPIGYIGKHVAFDDDVAIYTEADQHHEPLSNEQIRKWWASENGLEDCDMCKIDDFTKAVRAFEAKLKERNT